MRGDVKTLDPLVEETKPDPLVLDVHSLPRTRTRHTRRQAAEGDAFRLGADALPTLEAKNAVDLTTAAGFGYLFKDRVFNVEEFLRIA